MSALTLVYQALGFEDDGGTSNPSETSINVRRSLAKIPVDNPQTQKWDQDPLGQVTVVDGARSTSIDGTTEFSLVANPSDPTLYRVTATAGTAPVFRTARSVNVVGPNVTFTVNSNLTVTVTVSAGTPFGAIVAGDTVFIPGVTTGDATSPFNSLNEGYWDVLTASSSVLVLARASGEVFSGYTQTVTPTLAAQFQAFSTSGIQIGDTLDITAGFAAGTRHSYAVLAVNPLWLEFRSTSPLAQETGVIPGAAGFSIYTAAKRFLLIETTQDIVVRLNGDTGNTNIVSPLIPGDSSFKGSFMKFGPVWKLIIVNRSTAIARVTVASAE